MRARASADPYFESPDRNSERTAVFERRDVRAARAIGDQRDGAGGTERGRRADIGRITRGTRTRGDRFGEEIEESVEHAFLSARTARSCVQNAYILRLPLAQQLTVN